MLFGSFEFAEADRWLVLAGAAAIEPLIAFSASRGCYRDGRSLQRAHCRLPSVKRYRRAFVAFRQRWKPEGQHAQQLARFHSGWLAQYM